MDCARQRKPSRAAPTPEQVDAEVKQIDPRALKEFAEAAARYAKKNPWKPVHAANARGRLSRLLGSLGGAAIVTSSARGRQGANAGMHVAGERSSAAMRAACVMPKSRRGAKSAAAETESASIVAARSIPLGGELSPCPTESIRS